MRTRDAQHRPDGERAERQRADEQERAVALRPVPQATSASPTRVSCTSFCDLRGQSATTAGTSVSEVSQHRSTPVPQAMPNERIGRTSVVTNE